MGTIQKLLTDDFFNEGVYLFLGAADTGKTTLVFRIAAELAAQKTVAVVDADTGQSHIGPPATVGWAAAKPDENDLGDLPLGGIAFVGEISPVGHLLQETSAIVRCVQQASRRAATVLIDTPGFVSGSAACALWWEVARIVQPVAIIAVSRGSELNDVIRGLKNCGPSVEMIGCSDAVTQKSPEQRRVYRQQRFAEYFADAKICEINLKEIGVQGGRELNDENAKRRLVGLRDVEGIDIAMGVIVDWRDRDRTIVKAPGVDPKKIHCIVVGDATVDLPG